MPGFLAQVGHFYFNIMKEIVLTKGKVALVDDSDFEWLNQWKWYAYKAGNSFYAKRVEYYFDGNIRKRKMIKMHRLILGLKDPKIFVDHRDHDGLNNQRANIRPCNNSENQRNRQSAKGSSSNYLGVYWYKKYSNWNVKIHINGKQKTLGYFKTEIEAAMAYNEAAKIHHKEFANLNIIK